MDGRWSPIERAHVERMTRVSVVGSPETVRRGLEAWIDATKADELILTAQIHDHAARLRSFEIVADLHRSLGEVPRPTPAAER
jgi:alkanesulfonate monooxygenase SsuD/methylene tetrahydromethanopterin reductase-like flavin-dependent oxidoreductase (luciferase family)